MATIRKRGKYYQLDYYAHGKRVRETAKTKKEAIERLGTATGEIREGTYTDRRSLRKTRVEDLVREYFAKFRGRSARTERMHLNTIDEYFRGKIVSQVSVFDVETFLHVRRDMLTIKGKPRSAATVNRELGVLKRLINRAIEWNMARVNPVCKVKFLPEPKGRLRFLTRDESKRLLECCARHLYPVIVTALETGMRRGEIFGMRWENVDLKNRDIFIPHSKNGLSRHVPVSDRLRIILLKLPRRIGADYVFAGEPRIGRLGKPFNDMRTSFEKACVKAGIENFRFHDLRHTAASYMVMAGVPLKTVGEILGHKSMAMTERYAHLSPEHKRKAVNLLPDWSAGEDRSQTGHNSGTEGI